MCKLFGEILLLGLQEVSRISNQYIRKLPVIRQRFSTQYWPVIRDRAHYYALLCRFNKPVGIWLLLWPTQWGLWIAAEGYPGLHLLVVFSLGVILMRSAGCVLNDISDRDIDGHVQRTRLRPIASGKVTVKEALLLTSGLVLLAFILVLTTNALTIKLSFVALLFAIIYPLMKRYTYLPQFVLGLAFGWSIPMAFAAVNNEVNEIAWLLLACNVLWSVSYDTMYAMVDRDDDIKIGVKSTAILFGDADRLIIGIIQCMFLLGMSLIGQKLELGFTYSFALFIALLLSIYHQYLIRDRQPSGCFKAFLNNHYLGLVLFVGLLIHYG